MKLLHISLLVVLLIAVTVEGAKKRKNNHRDRDDGLSSRQAEDDQTAARKEEENVLRQKEKDNKKKEKAEKEEKPLKKAEDESSSSEEEDDKKDKENKTTIAPSRKRREYDSHGGQIYADIDRFDHQRNLNGGERTEIERTEGTATRPDYRKNSRTRRTLERHFNRARRTLEASSVSSEENTLKKATELNDGERRPVDKLPSQSTMPEKVKAHKRRAVRHSNIRNQSGNQHDSTEDTEEWKLENEEDYDDGGNSR